MTKPPRTTREIEEAFAAGEINAEYAACLLRVWDDVRVAEEAQELIARGEQPSGDFPAALWERYWALRLERDRHRLIPHSNMKAAQDRVGAPPMANVLTPSCVQRHLVSLGWPSDTKVTLEECRFCVEAPRPWRAPIGISVRQVKG